MLWFFFKCLEKFGFGPGLWIYIQIKILNKDSFFLPGLKEKIFFRPASDKVSFREIFLREEYAIQFPPELKPKIIIDAGANIGFTTLYFHRAFPNATIFSMEPDRSNFEVLKKNTERYSSIVPIQCALWPTTGSIQMSDKGYGVRGFVVEESSNSTSMMPSISMQDLLLNRKIGVIDILKIDIEGSEKEVFASKTEEWLPNVKCLIIELHDRMKPGCSLSVFRALSNLNFTCSIKGENLVFINQAL